VLLTLSAIFILLLLSAFFSGSETALTASSRPYMHQAEQNGDKRAGVVNRLQQNKEKMIGTLLLGNNLVNIMASAMATSVMISLFGDTGVIYATFGMTFLVLIFAEILPKTYAIHNSNKMALAIAKPVRSLVIILVPLTALVNFFARLVMRILGTDYHTSDALGSGDEELRGAIELHDGDDHKTIKHERAMLRSVLDLADVQVVEIMTHRKNTTTIDADLPVKDCVSAILESPYTRIPLWRDNPDNIVGVLHAKALLREFQARKGEIDDLDLVELAAEPWFIPEQSLLLDQLEAFRERREHFAMVIDEYGSLLGVVTLEDIIEEIVGDIDDEHDVIASDTKQELDGSLIVDGSTTIRDINREYELRLPDEEAATVAGLILHESRRIPQVGQSFMFHGIRFDILERQRNQITSVKMTSVDSAKKA
jgi:Mg2+/Co2+ transporter CorB